MKTQVWLITGAGRGLGRLMALAALKRGDRVIGTVRDDRSAARLKEDGIDGIKLDVTDAAAVPAAIAQAFDLYGRIDILVNNSGFGLLGAFEEVDDADVRAVFEVNVFGLLNVMRAALPKMRAARSGHIINIGSVGGLSASPGYGIYNAAKFAVEGLSESLAMQLAPLGIKVTIVEPGYLRTDFLADSSMRVAKRTIEDYSATVGAAHKLRAEFDGKQPGDPERCAQAIVNIAGLPDPPLRLVLGGDAVDRVRAKLASVEHDVAQWEQVARSIAYPAAK